MRAQVAIPVLFFVATSLHAATPDKGMARPAWEWTDEERIAARVPDSSTSGSIEIDGSKNPERYLPFELFGTLLRQIDQPDRMFASAGHVIYDQRLSQTGVDVPRFWKLIEDSSIDYLNTSRNLREIDVQIQSASRPSDTRALERQREAVSRRLCADRITALNTARQSLGTESFDRLLYTVVAPGSAMTSVANPHEADRLRYVAGGCK